MVARIIPVPYSDLMKLSQHAVDFRTEVGGSWGGDICRDDRFVGFYSEADNLVRHDTNDNPDAFIRRFR